MTSTTRGGVYALLADGRTIQIRPAGPGDLAAVRQMHEALSPDNAYLRFFAMSKQAAQRESERICRAPDSGHTALLAMLDRRLIGVASYEVVGEGVAEIAFTVADEMHGRGVATLLLEHLVSLARSRQIRTFTAQTLPENTQMLQVFTDAGLPVRRRLADGVVEITIPLPADVADRGLGPYLNAVASRESVANVASLRPVFGPESVAVAGASRRAGTVGRAILHNIITGGYAGRVYAVNPHADKVEGVACHPSVSALPETPDLVLIAVPPAAVPGVAEECGQRGVKGIVVITSGLDTGQGARLLAACRRHGMRLIGPNCFGVAVPGIGLDATFAARHPAPGAVGLVMQSGGIGFALVDHLSRLGMGISSFASVGNKYDVSGNDLLIWWEQDQVTRAAVLYIESFGNPRKFASTARRVGQTMPVLTVDAGRSAAGQRAAASHTSAVATPLVSRQALFEQAGIINTTDIGELLDAVALLASQPVPAGREVAVLSNVGGAGVLAADACVEHGLTVHTMSEDTRQKLERLVPPGGAVTGPVDTTATVTEKGFRECLELVAADPGVSAIIALVLPTGATGDLTEAIRAADVSIPLAAVALDQSEGVRMLPRALPAGGSGGAGLVPCYAYPKSAAQAVAHAARYGAWRARPQGGISALGDLRTTDARALVQQFLEHTPAGGWLPPAQASDLLRCYGIPLAAIRYAADADAAVRAAADIGLPVVLKADVPGLVHKSDVGAVQLDLRTEGDVRRAFTGLAEKFGSELAGTTVQAMITGGTEVIVGIVEDQVFGPLVVFGLGGVTTEVLADHTARLAPLTDAEADELIHGIRAAPLLFGHRGSPAVDIAGLRDTLLRVSRLADDLPEVAELDLNPVIARPDGVFAVDTRIRVAPYRPQDPFLRRLR